MPGSGSGGVVRRQVGYMIVLSTCVATVSSCTPSHSGRSAAHLSSQVAETAPNVDRRHSKCCAVFAQESNDVRISIFHSLPQWGKAGTDEAMEARG